MATIQIAAVGDILMWRTQIQSAKRADGNAYAFDGMFRPVAPYLKRADLTIANLETTLSGRESAYQKRIQKPVCPDELA
ncbi:hypothetical protein GCM10025857_31950 [Alicyclobacillus contaminans]|nr:hypothetical protein GCM10025857_31950 [Alicyclobacillus contaminans]